MIKGICILLVVVAHTVTFDMLPSVLSRICDAIFLNSFFMVSGHLARKEEDVNGKCFSRIAGKFYSLLIPYIVYSLLTIFWHIIICVGFHNTYVSDTYTGWQIVRRDLFCMVSGIGIGTLWFLPVLFVSFSLCLLLAEAAKRLPLPGYVLIGCSAFAFGLFGFFLEDMHIATDTLPGIIGDKYLYTFYRICNAAMYTLTGYLWHELWYRYRTSGRHRIYLILCSVAACACITYASPYKTIFAVCTTAAFVMATCLIFTNSNALTRPLLFLGRNSLAVMIYHYNFLYPIERPYFTGWCLFAVNLITSVLMLLFFSRFRWHYFFLGKKK